VKQSDDEAETLATFDREVRRKIRRAVEMGYEFRCSDSPAALAGLWPLYQECARRKGFRLERPLSVYMEAMRMARPDGCARVFAVYLNGKAVGSTLVVRDRDTAHCMLAAFEAEHRQAAVFLHWNSMRYMHAQGATRYNLGPGPGTLARFKEQFSPQGPECPPALTMVLKKGWFALWMNAVFPVAKMLRPTVRSAVSRLAVEKKPRVRRTAGRLQPAGHPRG
jgi:CelD/BcsL family acetyltransferase involved in cellulose biosynthesis